MKLIKNIKEMLKASKHIAKNKEIRLRGLVVPLIFLTATSIALFGSIGEFFLRISNIFEDRGIQILMRIAGGEYRIKSREDLQ